MSKVQTSKRPTIASGMKPNLQNAPNPFPPASSMSATARAKAKATSTLPIKKWSFGCELREGPYYLTWGNKQIEIKSGDPSKPSSHTTTLLFLDIDSVTVSEHSPKFEMVIRFETMKPLNGRQIPGDPNTFIQGETDGRGAITILLDNNSPSFPLSMATYEKFSALLKKDITESYFLVNIEIKSDFLLFASGGASLAIWNQTMQSVNLGSSALSPPTPENDPTPIEPPEESRRSSRQKQRKRPPTMDPDEVILVYPPETPGAVPITNADLARLDPGEFLNDTLIEFGLKLWLKELETENPELAKQIHIFNSFFYKKLNKKNLSEGYNDVKRWTAKIDIFEKKIIIIPINENLHWYLAVIYNPANMLVPPPPPIVIPSPATRSRVSTAGVSEKEPTPESIPPSEDHPMDDNRMVVDGVSSPHSSENQVAKDLLFENPSSGIAIDSTAIHNSLSIMDLEDEDDELLLIAKSDHDATASERSAEAKSIPPTRFYGKNATSDKGGRQSPEAYIFTLDSLGSRHPKVISVLQQYLMMEAEQRRHLSNTSKATGKTAPVPAQPNYCDCGVYLLHFAKTFAMNHERLCEYITLSTNKKNNSMEERCSKWDSGKLEGFRESLKGQLETLSKEWKALRAAKVEPKKPEEAPATPSADDAETAADSDSDIEIVEEKSAPRKSPKKSKAKTTAKPALRIR
ncbi:hypothetical protein C8J56DRAFT_910342 [Mycena floridula]|nr:hypothetical protein C8J56DRAFT_910342 [Mycena floridula]